MSAPNLDQAIAQVSEIHAQVLRSEVFRGYRSETQLLTALAAGGTALIQSFFLVPSSPKAFVLQWLALALCCAGIGFWDVFRGQSLALPGQWRQSLRVVAQSLPALWAGAMLSLIFLWRGSNLALLPGLWALLFGLAVFSARPYLPRRVGFVGLFYLLAGLLQLCLLQPESPPSPWSMGLTFGLGQAGLALALFRNVERAP